MAAWERGQLHIFHILHVGYMYVHGCYTSACLSVCLSVNMSIGTHIPDVLLDALGQVKEEAIPLQHGEGVSGGVCPTLALQYALKQTLRIASRCWRERRREGEREGERGRKREREREREGERGRERGREREREGESGREGWREGEIGKESELIGSVLVLMRATNLSVAPQSGRSEFLPETRSRS